jgi:integrase
MRKSLTDKGVAALKPRAQRYAFPDPELTGHYVRVTPGGSKSFAAVARSNGKQVWTHIGAADVMTIAEARDQAREILKRVRAGLPATEAKGETFAIIAVNWLKRHVDANKLRSCREIRRLLDVHVLPVWGDREFLSIRRSDVAALLDEIEDDHSARQADAVLTVVRSLMNWFATRQDDYTPPIVRGMRRQSPHQMARARVLTDDELRAIWTASEGAGPFGAGVRLCFLTAQRKSKVFQMRWAEIEGNEWTIPKAPREKDNAGVLVLPRSQYTTDYKHFIRWHMVQIRFDAFGIKPMPGRAKKGQGSAGGIYEKVSKLLEQTVAAATWEQVRDSWKLVEKARARGKDQRFRFEFPETIPAAPHRGSNRNR